MKSILVIGVGKLGNHLADKLLQLGNEVMVVDSSEEVIERMNENFTEAVIGDCTNEAVIRSLGINNFDICFVTVGANFQASLEITSMLSELGAKYIVSKARSERQAGMLKKVGANEVIFPEKEVADKLAIRYNAENIFDFIELTPDFSIFEIPILNQWSGRTLADVNVRRKHHINIIAVKNENTILPMPSADYIFKANDHLVVIGKSSDVFDLVGKIKES